MRDIDALIKEAHGNAVERGFYPEGKDKNIGELFMLVVSELGEALEAHRNNRFTDWKAYEMLMEIHNKKEWNRDDFKIENAQYYFESSIKDTFEDEIADVFIRLFDLCGYLEIDIEKHIKAKMAYNRTRPHKHGKEY